MVKFTKLLQLSRP